MDEKSFLSTNIRICREAADLTQDELASILGVGSRSTVAGWENGHSAPEAYLVPRIANALNVTVDDLYMEGFKSAYRVIGDDSAGTYSEQVRKSLAKAGNISLETAEVCCKAIADELKARSTQDSDLEPISFPLFLSMRDDDYFIMKEKTKLLRKLKQQHHYSFSEIQHHMNSIDIDYDEHICLGYYYMLFSGDKVPSQQLYERLYAFLSKTKSRK